MHQPTSIGILTFCQLCFELFLNVCDTAFSFPFIFAICRQENVIEVKSVMDEVFHEVLRCPITPTGSKLSKIYDDGRTVLVAIADNIFILQPQINKRDVRHIVKNFSRVGLNFALSDSSPRLWVSIATLRR